MPRDESWSSDEDLLLDAVRAAVGDDPARGPRPTIDGYDVIAEISRGGQGVVSLARQRATRRLVAIKVLLDPSLASPEARRRFEREAEIVATLDHPGIVRVFDAGTTADGHPYLVMEHVDGAPLDRAAMLREREPGAIASLLAAVCDALHAAHLRGVIHRDVKPSNVLVDGEGRPRLLDFGLARATLARGAVPERSALSLGGQFLGSLPWASPEQASGDPRRIDVRSDVYSAGVVLFQALTGEFPYPIDGSLASTLHAIESVEPRRPSAVRRGVPRDLEAIVAAALAKDPARRYQSAADLAADLRAFGAGEPILVRRETTIATMARVVRRYRRTALAAAAGALVLAAIAGVALRQASVARTERARAERRFAQVREIASELLFDLHAAIQPLDGSRNARELLVGSMLAYLRDLAPDAGDDPSFMSELALAWERVGDIQGNPTMPNLGQVEAALASYRSAIELRRTVAATVGDAESHVRLAAALGALGFAQHHGGDPPGALVAFDDAARELAIAERIDPGEAPTAQGARIHMTILERRSDALAQLRRTDEAAAALDEAMRVADTLPVRETDPVEFQRIRGILHGKVAATFFEAERAADALPHAEAAVALQREVAAARGNALERGAVAIELNTLSTIQHALGRVDDAGASAAESVAVARGILEIDPSDVLARRGLSYSLIRLGQALAAQGEADAAVAALAEAISLRRGLREQAPTNASARRSEIIAMSYLAEAQAAFADDATRADDERRGRSADAEARYRAAADLLDGLAADGQLLPADAGMGGAWRSRADGLRERRESAPPG